MMIFNMKIITLDNYAKSINGIIVAAADGDSTDGDVA